MDGGRHRPQSHLNTTPRTLASALLPASPEGDHSASTEHHDNIPIIFR